MKAEEQHTSLRVAQCLAGGGKGKSWLSCFSFWALCAPAPLLELAASEQGRQQQDVLWCHRGGSSDLAEQRCSAKNRLSQRSRMPKTAVEIFPFFRAVLDLLSSAGGS